MNRSITLEQSEAKYRAIVETAQEGIIALDPDGEILLANEKLAELIGYPVEDVYEAGLWGTLEPDLAEQIELDSEGGMFAAFGRRRQMKRIQGVLAPYLMDSGLVADTLAAAAREGFDFDD